MRIAIATFVLTSFVASGADLVASVGGPDAFGYTWTDNDESACDSAFFDIRATGDLVVSGDDEGSHLDLGGPGFDIYGQQVLTALVSTNGYLTTDGDGSNMSSDCPLPNPFPPNGTIYALWSDLTNSSVYHQYFADCPVGSRFAIPAGCNIIQWQAGVGPGPPGSEHLQVVLFDSYDFTVQISESIHDGSYAVIGVENAQGSIGLAAVCDNPGTIDPEIAFCFFHPAPVPTVIHKDGFESGSTDQWTYTTYHLGRNISGG